MEAYRKILWGLMVCGCGLLCGCSDSDTEPVDSGEGKGEETPLPEKGTMFADFETYDTTPYFFRYGNNVSDYKTYTYYPRWAYTHAVVDNPLANDDNASAKVLEYTTMEARNFGLKLRFAEAKPVQSVKGIRFQIYQPANVIGKDTWKGTSKATSQRLGVKLIGSFNAVNDCVQEEGVVLDRSLVSFEEQGVWKTYTFAFGNEYATASASLLPDGIAGIVIMPTYGASVTLAEDEESWYRCYIDNIEIL